MFRGTRVDARRVAAVVAVLAITLALLGRSAFGAFEGAANVTHTTESGTLGLTVTDGDAAQPAAVVVGGASYPNPSTGFGFGPGSSNQRLINVQITGSLDFASLALQTGALFGQPSELVDDAVNGLQVKIERCSVPWSGSGVAPNKTYTCSGTTSLVQDTQSYYGIKNLTADVGDSLLQVGNTNYYRFLYSLPTTATLTMQGLASVAVITVFNGTQRAATNK